MAAIGPGGSKLAELVPNHVLGHIDRHVLASVMDRKGMPDKIGEERLQVLRTCFFSPLSFIF